MKVAVLSVGIVLAGFLAKADKAYLSLYVKDAVSHAPLSGIKAIASFKDDIGWRAWTEEPKPDIVEGITDKHGYCRLSGKTNCGKSSCWIEKAPQGYYKPRHGGWATYAGKSVFGVWQPENLVVTLALQRVEHPVPLYVKRVQLRDQERRGIGGFDGTNAVLRFDFVAGDWLPPHGNGRRADFEIRTRYRLKEVVKDSLYKGLSFYEFTSEVAFFGEGNGLVERSFAGVNCGIKLRTAPEGGYSFGKTLRFGRRRKKSPVMGIWPEDYTESDEDRCYCFRVRSRFDERGRLVEAYYGKIYGDFNFEGWPKTGFCGVSFLYYLNPRPLDRNLEWDVKRNLCPDPGNLQYRSIASNVYPEP